MLGKPEPLTCDYHRNSGEMCCWINTATLVAAVWLNSAKPHCSSCELVLLTACCFLQVQGLWWQQYGSARQNPTEAHVNELLQLPVVFSRYRDYGDSSQLPGSAKTHCGW